MPFSTNVISGGSYFSMAGDAVRQLSTARRRQYFDRQWVNLYAEGATDNFFITHPHISQGGHDGTTPVSAGPDGGGVL